MGRHRYKERVVRGHVAPPVPPPPQLAAEVPLLLRLERAVEDEFRAPMLARLEQRLREEEALLRGHAPRCPDCGLPMAARGRKATSFITRFGTARVRPRGYRCSPCRRHERPLLTRLGVEAGQVSGALARLLALLGVVVPYELAAQLAHLCFGVTVSPMTVWRAVQRLGAACERYVVEQAAYYADARNPRPQGPTTPTAVVLGVDGCALGMQVRPRRRRRQAGQELAPLPALDEGQFREVKTGVLLLPAERCEPRPGRRSVVRRVLCTCLGEADRIFERLWAQLCAYGWLSPTTVVVIVGDGAEWIWKRATLFPNRCEILDFWHAIEYAWDFARLRYGEESTHAATWVHRLATDLRAGRLDVVLARLGRQRVTTPEQRDALVALVRYYTENRSRMRYDEYLRLGYGIGSGAVESAHKQVVQARMRQAGMRWSERGARHLLALRILLLNDQWALLDRLTMGRLAA